MKKNTPANDTGIGYRPAGQEMARHAVCLCTDRRMLIPALFVAHSIKSHSAAEDKSFDVIVCAQPQEVTDVHRNWMKQHDIILCEDMDISEMRGVGNFQERLSPATLMKLVLAGHFAGRYEKILYLDCDLTIHGDVSVLFSLDTAPFALAAVPSGRILLNLSEHQREVIENHLHQLGMTRPYRFFNTGVLLIDVERWNREKPGEKALEFIRQNTDICSLPDEHALNAVLDGKMAQLSAAWNCVPLSRSRSKSAGLYHPVIVHHTGANKPWRRFCYGKGIFPDLTAYKMYRDFLKDTPWPKWLGEQWNWRDLYLNIRGEIGNILRRLGLRGKWEGPSARQRLEYKKAVRRFYEEERFADVEQGIVLRENGRFRVRATIAGPVKNS
ncbi:MAG: glycosyltransferase [Smithella sp.]|nr:glycosyltransferase [Smithella sp.]